MDESFSASISHHIAHTRSIYLDIVDYQFYNFLMMTEMRETVRQRVAVFIAGVILCSAISGSISLIAKRSEAPMDIRAGTTRMRALDGGKQYGNGSVGNSGTLVGGKQLRMEDQHGDLMGVLSLFILCIIGCAMTALGAALLVRRRVGAIKFGPGDTANGLEGEEDEEVEMMADEIV